MKNHQKNEDESRKSVFEFFVNQHSNFFVIECDAVAIVLFGCRFFNPNIINFQALHFFRLLKCPNVIFQLKIRFLSE